MNVLVYSGPEVLQISLNHTLTSLKSILFPHYSVQPITQRAVVSEPWAATCALLVVPHCRGRFLSSSASKLMQEYVEDGGAYLGVGTGARYSPRGLATGFANLNLGTSSGEDIRLRFFNKFNGSYIYPETSGGGIPRLAELRSPDGQVVKRVFDVSIGKFVGFDDAKGVVILAHYADREDATAGITLDVSGGKVALWSPNIEYPLSEGPASSLLRQITPSEIESIEISRRKLLKTTLIQLGLHIPEAEGKSIARPLPQFLTSAPTKPHVVSTIIQAIAAPAPSSELSVFKDDNDTFQFASLTDSSKLLEETRANAFIPSDPSTWQPKHIVICSDGELPTRELTPLFDLELFYRSLAIARSQKELTTKPESWGIGEALLYGEAVTSTQTMLDKNPKLLSQLPTPLLSLASHQLAGRGRGSNIWLSPAGCLMFSILLRVSLPSFPASKLVFIQYLVSLAVVEACREESVLGVLGKDVRLKWPNDLYALIGEDKRKVGGVLVNTSFSGSKVDIVVGCGLNILNPPPITSISQLLPRNKRDTLSIEKTAAAIMATFESMWTIFVKNNGSFEPFMDLYLKRWLHSDQLVTLTTTNPHSLVRITGITPDHGLLRTLPERPTSASSPAYVDLQPDGNSFDLMAGLIKSKG